VLAGAAPFAGEVALLGGVHLHWALPDGLTHSLGTDGFPPAPNRWLVTRIPLDGAMRSWVVESDRLNTSETAPAGLQQPTVPMQPTPGQNFRYLGKAFPYEGWSEQGSAVERLTPLTAVGYGEPTFAAMYPNSSTVFGFYDGLDGVDANATLGYHVAGWYADEDPLAKGTLDRHKNRFRWRWSGGAVPTATVCSGIVAGIPWDRASAYLSDPAKPLSVAIGGSGQEAISALLAAALDPHAYPHVEWLLNALQFGVLAQGGGVAEVAEAVHAAGFARLPGGTRWTPREQAPADDLDRLNSAQRGLDASERDRHARRERLFADWHKYLLVAYDSDDAPVELQGRAADVQARLEAEIAQITVMGARSEQLARERDELRGRLGDGLTEATTARFYQPAEPVLVLSGHDAAAPARYGGDGYLSCRLDTEVLEAVTLAAGLVAGSEPVVLPASELPGPRGALGALVREALLLAAQPVVAAAVAARGGPGNPAVLDLAATTAALEKAAASLLAGEPTGPVSYTGSAPDATILNAWAGTPWLPLRLDYELSFAPVQRAPYRPDFIDEHFTLAPGATELAYRGTAPARTQPYQGTAILSPEATVDLAAEIQRQLDNAGPDDELARILGALKQLPILAQRLTGALPAMLMRNLALQLGVSDPLAPGPARAFPAAVASAVGDATALSPLPENSFNPIPTGAATVTRLRLVDAFGRFKDWDAPELIVAAGLAPPGQLEAPQGTAFLPPRITQPARLGFRWLSAGEHALETNDAPASTPIAGWVLPLWLDRTLALHAADGTPVGLLTASSDGRRVTWTPAPGGPFPPGTALETALEPRDPALRAFALAAHNGGDGSFLAPFLEAVRDALAFALPAAFREGAETAVLAGQPLALARARLRLELAGPPATDLSWASFVAEVLAGAPGDDAGLSRVSFPVRLGALGRLDDTLVGFWAQERGSIDFGKFFALSATRTSGPVRQPAQDTVALAAGEPVEVMLLLDPRGCVHASTGVLPVKAIDIPRAHYADALSALVPTLAAHPLLAGAGGPAFALPKLSDGSWSWVTAAGGAWATAPAREARSEATLDYTPQRIVEGWLAP
jgi:hypothetical protein